MKKKEIPDFIFKKQYDYYFLFTEFDIVFNDIFYDKFNVFLSKLESKKIIISLDNIPESLNFNEFKSEYNYVIPNINILKSFHEFEDNNVPIYNINHFIKDNTLDWQVFITIERELSIFAINKNLIEIFKQIFKPYEEESLDVKINVIAGRFNDESYRKQFIERLIENYALRKVPAGASKNNSNG